ncbi:hypothetical protein OG203_30890 [Nocardia sp. NBC_01499]|uniref:hypothetical protein n=1 Tax=Nocardia sp. NBC_01499 TaxID=2903597 RepID=UPI00386C022B
MTTDERRTYRRQRPPAVPENIDPPEDETARMFGAPCPVRSGEEVTYDHAEHSGHGYILRVISIDGIAVCEVAGDDQRRVLVPPWRVTPVDPKPEFKTFTGQMNTLVATQCRRATCTLRKRHRSADKLFGRMTEEFASFARAVADGEPRVAIMEWSRKIKELQHKINEYSEYRDLVIEFALLTEDDAHRILTTPPQPSRAATSNTARRQRKTRHAT